jgi:hypothetical protein
LVGVIATCSGLDAPAWAASCPLRPQDPAPATHTPTESRGDKASDEQKSGDQNSGAQTGDEQGDEPRDFEPVYSRWLAPGYTPEGLDLTGYEINEIAHPWNPYHQNPLKGDFPIFGTDDLFFAFTGTLRQTVEYKRVPTPSGNTGATADFFGNPNQHAFTTQVAMTFDLFEAPQAFEPVEWRVRVTPVFQRSEVDVNEVGVIDVDPSAGTRRIDNDFALQEAFVEYHLANISPYYDFVSVEAGILPFRSDFRGFVFDDTNLGARFSGNWDRNKWQYNLAFFDMLDKDTNSGLNEFEDRQQEVIVANVYRQDFPFEGHTTELSFHYNNDHRGVHFDDNGGLVSPAPIGLAQENNVETYYFGVAGEGHVGRFNVTEAFYHAMGRDSQNPIAGREVDINANMAALEVSYDFDWMRLRGFGLFASGDDDARDGHARGFDAILDAPAFAGGELAYFDSQAIRLLGVNLTNAGSHLVDLQSSQTEGHSNFVNPGLLLMGGAMDFELTPKWRAQIGASYLLFAQTDALETYLQLPDIDREIGTELFFGTSYRPLLTNNIIALVGASVLFPGEGLQRIYQSSDTLYATSVSLLFTF